MCAGACRVVDILVSVNLCALLVVLSTFKGDTLLFKGQAATASPRDPGC